MFKFNVVSTGQRVGNLNEEPTLRIYPEMNRFKVNNQLALGLSVKAEDSVTILYDSESNCYALHAAIPKKDKAGKVIMKEKRLSEDQKEALKAEGEPIPTEIDYVNACKLGKHLEFASSNAVLQAGLEGSDVIESTVHKVFDGSQLGLDVSSPVYVFSIDNDETIFGEDNEEEEAEEVEV